MNRSDRYKGSSASAASNAKKVWHPTSFRTRQQVKRLKESGCNSSSPASSVATRVSRFLSLAQVLSSEQRMSWMTEN
ncbi:hypothetical protein NEHOM01_0318 [Nematocida homosporus]|uniref:uncharacterized protein n=1 Tax=Nematocida homosporus TaxID=1912981 RepID=UPI00221EE962|nr:uncharacterized protein NEHOM01_0318 [Nematocida homosporus]KAI5184716.1 hypothetical protein NEHOM01_0318 [Nematocida homosporus]